MRTATVELGGVRYPAAFTLSVLRDMEDRTGKPASEALDAIADGGKITDTVWLLAELLAAGAKVTGSTATPPTEAELLDMLGVDDLHAITAQILGATRTIKPAVEVELKNRNAKLRRALQTLFG